MCAACVCPSWVSRPVQTISGTQEGWWLGVGWRSLAVPHGGPSCREEGPR